MLWYKAAALLFTTKGIKGQNYFNIQIEKKIICSQSIWLRLFQGSQGWNNVLSAGLRQVDYFSGRASNFLSSLSLGGTKGGGTVDLWTSFGAQGPKFQDPKGGCRLMEIQLYLHDKHLKDWCP